MPSLSQSPILQALGYAIAHSLWQMAMVWIVYVLLNSLFKFKSEIKYRIAVAAQVVGFAWFIGTLQFYYIQCSQAMKLAESVYLESGDQSAVVFASNKSSLLSFFIRAEQVLPYLSVAYLLLLVFLTIRWFRAYRYTQIVRLNGLHKIDVDWKLFVNKVAGQLGIKQQIRIYLSELVQSPVTIGFLKPVILVPIASINHLTAQQLEAVILHELAHIKRHDYLLNLILSIIDLGLFFNPFTKLITKSVSKERENSCDDWVLQYQYNPAMYAEALLRIAVMQKTPAMAIYAVKTKSELAMRVQRMVNQKDGRFSYRHQLMALLLMTGILASIAWYDPNALKSQDVKPSAENTAVVVEPLAIKVNNPLFNPVFFLNKPLKDEVKKNVEATQKQISKLREKAALAVREIHLPTIMAPVAIENLKELERNINSTVNNKIRRVFFRPVPPAAPAHFKAVQGEVFNNQNMNFRFDTIKFTNAFAYNGDVNINWNDLTEELNKSQKAIQDAFNKGQISIAESKKMQAEIATALTKLKNMKMPQVYGFAPAEGQDFFRSDEDNEEASNNMKARSDEKRKALQMRQRSNELKIRRVLVDSLKKRVMQGFTPVKTQGYVARDGKAPYIVLDNQQAMAYLNAKPGISFEKQQMLPSVVEGDDENIAETATCYNYNYSENNDEECNKANNICKHNTAVAIARKPKLINRNRSKPTIAHKEKCIQITVTASPSPPAAESLIVNVEVE